jgi:fumarate hydratase class I
MTEIQLPVEEEKIRELHIGETVTISGVMLTARDAAHKYLIEESPDEFRPILQGSFIYHCGPIVRKKDDNWEIVAAGPTTSIREEPYESSVIENYGVRGVIGKGGMGNNTLDACSRFGCVYLSAVGGAATLLAQAVKEVLGVYKLEEFGVPEAMWHIDVRDFPAIVTMDSHNQSLHVKIEEESRRRAAEIIGI